MRKSFQLIGIVSITVAIAIGGYAIAHTKQDVQQNYSPGTLGEYRLSGPFTHKNLTIYLIHGKDKINGFNILTLPEALEQKKVIVHETSNVNELSIENVSDQEVFVQAGDIVKGGKQDRCLAVDMIVPPKSGNIPIAAFCVESGRWRQRGSEGAVAFSESINVLASKDLKLAAKSKKSQSEVWENVSKTQDKLSKAANANVTADASASSLELTLENKQVQQNTEEYVNTLSKVASTKDSGDVLGYVFAINGKINSADVYPTNGLFQKLWPRLLKASAMEAFAESSAQQTSADVTADMIKTFLTNADQASASEKEVTKRTRLVTRESEKNVMFETTDQSRKAQWVHRNYIAK